MLGGILIIILTGFISFLIIDQLKNKYPYIDAALLKNLFGYHVLLAFAYYAYAVTSGSDSAFYYTKILVNFRGDSWIDFYGTSTTFIEFIGYPFVKFIGLSYEAMMFLFSFFGYLGFVYFYIFFKENIKFSHTFLSLDLFKIILFLPNLHFWSSSFGKGSVIFLGIALYFFGISKLRERVLATIIGSIIIYHVRPHIMLVILVSSAMGFIFTSKGVSIAVRVMFLVGAGVGFFFIYRDVLALVGIDEHEFVSQGLDLAHRASELSKAGSGLNITQYSLPVQVLTFLYRPLFVDANGALGIIVSFENVFYVLISAKILLNLRGLKFLLYNNFLVKSALLSFIGISIALAQISGNLGLAMRQKSQVMILFMFVILSFLDEEKSKVLRKKQLFRMRQVQTRSKNATT